MKEIAISAIYLPKFKILYEAGRKYKTKSVPVGSFIGLNEPIRTNFPVPIVPPTKIY
jgi:hypothetical protein